MTDQVAFNDRRVPYTATASQTVFDIDFPLDNVDYIVVYQNGNPLDPSDYTVDLTALTVTLDTGAALNDSIVLEGLRTIKRISGYPLRGGLPSSLLNLDMNALIYMLQEMRRDLDRSISFNKSDTTATNHFLQVLDPGAVLKVSDDGTGIENGPQSVDVLTVAGISDDVSAVAAIAANVTAVAGNSAHINTVAGISANITTVAGISGNVTTVAGISGNVTTVAGISGNVTTVAGISAAVSTVAGMSANISSIAADLTNINNVAADLTNINNVAADLTNINSVAADLTAINAVYADLSKLEAIYADLSNLDGIHADLTNLNNVAADLVASIDPVATNIANVNTVAGLSASITTLAGISGDITAAANNIPKANRSATTNPGVGNDNTQGYSYGSQWVNTSTHAIYFCVSAATGAAIWQSVAGSLSGLSDVTLTSLASGDFLKYNGSAWVNRTAANVRSDLGLVIGTNVTAWDPDLDAIAALASTGFAVRTGAATWAQRSIAGGGGITITNGDGVSGNPTIGVSALKTLWIPAAALRPSQTGGCAALALVASGANEPDMSTLDFDPTTQQYAQFSVRFPKGWNAGTVTAAFVWSHPSTSTNFGAVWSLQGVSIADNEAMAVAYGTAQQIADTGGTTDKQYISGNTPAITIGGTPAAGEVVYFRASRVAADGSDTLAVNARLHGIMLFYTITTLDDT